MGERIELIRKLLFIHMTFLLLLFIKVSILYLLNGIIEIIRVTENRKYFSLVPHVGQHWSTEC